MKEEKSAISLGIKAGLITSLCCITPVILAIVFVLTGIGSVALALSIPKYRSYFIAASIIFMIASVWTHIKREKGVCNINAINEYRIFILTMMVVYTAFFILTVYVVLPVVVEKLLQII